MKSESLDFPDDFFTHSIMGIAIFMTANGGLDAERKSTARLNPGITWFLLVKESQEAIIGNGRPWPVAVNTWSDGTRLRSVMEEAGFKKQCISMMSSELFAKTGDLHAWAETTRAYLGRLPGWIEKDEEKWDEAVTLLEEKLRTAPGFQIMQDGEFRMVVTQHVLVAEK
ncbi:hypothetical protein K432DRAFT_406837 [Lepidopterella palustris CBS 459.81]|uniref:S-adenosyl-L-methionine-dependent methyltransferase n=1 Tax=Lepidopterella palustris CBS 459.81 TaxID=1314670 RepID=A0A8E2E5X6_9PEZI|nr:hypothetical protein K432DRAFT_406837 [Lepidopterella palustris CBS 459.81]